MKQNGEKKEKEMACNTMCSGIIIYSLSPHKFCSKSKCQKFPPCVQIEKEIIIIKFSAIFSIKRSKVQIIISHFK